MASMQDGPRSGQDLALDFAAAFARTRARSLHALDLGQALTDGRSLNQTTDTNIAAAGCVALDGHDPQRIRDAMHLVPGAPVEFSVNAAGEVVLHPARPAARGRNPARDRFDAVRGRADVHWRTDELMKLLRADGSIAQLRAQAKLHALVINPVIYVEMSLSFSTLEALDDVVSTMEPELREIPGPGLFLAARAYAQYRRRGGSKGQVLPDFPTLDVIAS